MKIISENTDPTYLRHRAIEELRGCDTPGQGKRKSIGMAIQLLTLAYFYEATQT